MERYKEIEKSIIKKYRKDIWSKFVKVVQDYKLINENDKIMVCISGGKDSFLLAKCIEELIRHGKFYFEAKYVVMDPGYSEKHKREILDVARTLNLDIEIFKSDIFDIVQFSLLVMLTIGQFSLLKLLIRLITVGVSPETDKIIITQFSYVL